MTPPFLPGLELSRRLFAEAVRPLLAERFPDLPYSAARIGYGSEVLGYDTTAVLTDPRLARAALRGVLAG